MNDAAKQTTRAMPITPERLARLLREEGLIVDPEVERARQEARDRAEKVRAKYRARGL